jgi:hypothetical protein
MRDRLQRTLQIGGNRLAPGDVAHALRHQIDDQSALHARLRQSLAGVQPGNVRAVQARQRQSGRNGTKTQGAKTSKGKHGSRLQRLDEGQSFLDGDAFKAASPPHADLRSQISDLKSQISNLKFEI